jgi:hypothetical protein
MTRPNYTVLTARARTRGGALARGVGSYAPQLGACCVLAVGLLAWPYTVDDAFITARYARNLTHGSGYALNPGAPSDGVTGPLWLVPELAALWIGGDPIVVAKALGLACAAWAAWLVLRALRQRSGGHAAACAALVLIAVAPSLGTWAVAGLETGAATLLLVAAALAAVRRPRVAEWRLGGCVAALAWLRPELALASGVLLAYAALRDARAGTRAFALALCGALALLWFRWWMFGDALPLSFRAKAGSLAQGAADAARGVLLATSVFGIVLVAIGARRGRAADRAIATALVAHLLAIVLAGGDWMPGYRLLVPVLPLYALLAGVGVARAGTRAAWLLVGLACAVPALDLPMRIPELRDNAYTRARMVELAHWLNDRTRRVALVDVGLIGYASDIDIVDLAGLTDARIARLPGGHLGKRVDPRDLQARNPDAIVVHCADTPRISEDRRLLACAGFEVERRVLAMPFVQAGYRVGHVAEVTPRYDYRSSYTYVVLMRAEPDEPTAPRER